MLWKAFWQPIGTDARSESAANPKIALIVVLSLLVASTKLGDKSSKYSMLKTANDDVVASNNHPCGLEQLHLILH